MCNSLRPHELHIAHQASLSFTISLSLLKLTSIESVISSTQLILCCSLLPLLSIFPRIRVFSRAGSLHQETKMLELQFQHQSFQWIFRVDFLEDWLVGSPCCPRDSQESFQHYNSKASVLQHSIFLMVQLSYPYMTTGKTIALTIWIFVSKMMSLLFNMLSRFVTAFLPRSECLWISWLWSPSTVILEPK